MCTANTRVLTACNSEARWGIGILACAILLGVLVPMPRPYNPLKSSGDTFISPGTPHFFGTDQLGRDVFTRTFAAAQLDISLAVIGVFIPLVIGTLLGGILGTTRNPLVSSAWLIIID